MPVTSSNLDGVTFLGTYPFVAQGNKHLTRFSAYVAADVDISSLYCVMIVGGVEQISSNFTNSNTSSEFIAYFGKNPYHINISYKQLDGKQLVKGTKTFDIWVSGTDDLIISSLVFNQGSSPSLTMSDELSDSDEII